MPTNPTNAIAVSAGYAGETDWGVDTDIDGLPDSWELRYFGDLNQNGSGDVDGDGSTNLQEYNAHSNPANNLFAWGFNANGESTVPFSLTNAMAMGLAGGLHHSMALKEDGTIVGWGTNDFSQLSTPSGLTNLLAIATGDNHSLALKSNGTVVAWGRNNSGQTNVPSGLANVVAIAAGGNQSLALKSDGMVTNWGESFGNAPASVTNVIAIACGTNFCVALRSNGTVVAWGNNTYGQTNVAANLANIVAIAAGGAHSLAVSNNGTVIAWGSNGSGETNVPSGLTNAMNVAAGYAHSLALRNDGTVIGWGDNTYGQTNVVSGLASVKSLAAGAYHSLAARFSTLIQYPIDVSKDMLVIYNTNSLNSSNVWYYYLQHRPMVSNANVLGISCTTNETFMTDDYTNSFVPQIQNWLNLNPTKRPQYVVLFPTIPSRVNSYSNEPPGVYWISGASASVQYRLHAFTQGWQPFVTSINLRTTNDCLAYIDKVAGFGATNSPGKLIISASSGGYANTNYVLDNVRHGVGYGLDNRTESGATIWITTNGLLSSGVTLSAILYTNGLETIIGGVETNPPHITNAMNLAGYISWGSHSKLGKDYALDGTIQWGSGCQWYLVQTIESYNGVRINNSLEFPTYQASFLDWFSPNAFDGTNYSYLKTPVGAVSFVDEPELPGVNNPAIYFGLWAGGKNFAISAWNSRRTDKFQAVGDPFVTR